MMLPSVSQTSEPHGCHGPGLEVAESLWQVAWQEILGIKAIMAETVFTPGDYGAWHRW